jgi:ADP-ribose pyrophosphatase YjhB (NUDIX family)
MSEPCAPETGNCVHREYRGPRVSADVIVTIGGKILLVKRRNPPYGWAIPGGFIEYGESAEDAAARELREETGIGLEDLAQFHVYSEPGRDPRFHTVTVVFTATSSDTPIAGDDAAEISLFNPDELPSPLAFDHGQILEDYLGSLKTQQK